MTFLTIKHCFSLLRYNLLVDILVIEIVLNSVRISASVTFYISRFGETNFNWDSYLAFTNTMAAPPELFLGLDPDSKSETLIKTSVFFCLLMYRTLGPYLPSRSSKPWSLAVREAKIVNLIR